MGGPRGGAHLGLDIPLPASAIAHNVAEARAVATRIGFPLLVRPSYVLGGRSVAICCDDTDFAKVVDDAIATSEARSLLVDRCLQGAREYDVDALSDGHEVVIGGVVEHIEEAGVHSGPLPA